MHFHFLSTGKQDKKDEKGIKVTLKKKLLLKIACYHAPPMVKPVAQGEQSLFSTHPKTSFSVLHLFLL